jgi:CheY-like chemotaxis protein
VTRLLIVDDDEDNLNLFTAILENFQFTVIPYSDPVTALLEFKAGYYDLIILDYLMPSINGIELCKKIIDIDKSVKIMILTASHERIEACLQDRTDLKIVRKPVSITNLMQEINSLIFTDIMKVPI